MLFSDILKFAENIFLKEQLFVKDYLENCFEIFCTILFAKMESSKLNNYSTETRGTCKSTMVIKKKQLLNFPSGSRSISKIHNKIIESIERPCKHIYIYKVHLEKLPNCILRVPYTCVILIRSSQK
jgi:hypothetical protein